MGKAEKVSGDEPVEANARPRPGTGGEAAPAEPAGPGTPREISRDIRNTGTSRGTREHRDIPGIARDIRESGTSQRASRTRRGIPEGIPHTGTHRGAAPGALDEHHRHSEGTLWRSIPGHPRQRSPSSNSSSFCFKIFLLGRES